MALLNLYIFVCVISCSALLDGRPIGSRPSADQDDLSHRPPSSASGDSVWTSAKRLISSYFSHWLSSSCVPNDESRPSTLLFENWSDCQTSIPAATELVPSVSHAKKGTRDTVGDTFEKQTSSDEFQTYMWLGDVKMYVGCIFLPLHDIWESIKYDDNTTNLTNQRQPYLSRGKYGDGGAVLDSSQRWSTDRKNSNLLLTGLDDCRGRNGNRSDSRTLILTTERRLRVSPKRIDAGWPDLYTFQPSPTDQKRKITTPMFSTLWQ